jgi:hypothetical protein
MGRSVNLAARLMSACTSVKAPTALPQTDSYTAGILVDSEVHRMAHAELHFKQMLSIRAKGYPEPVTVFAPMSNATVQDSYLNCFPRALSGVSHRAICSVPENGDSSKTTGDCKRHLTIFRARHSTTFNDVAALTLRVALSAQKADLRADRRCSAPFISIGHLPPPSASVDTIARRSSIARTSGSQAAQQLSLPTLKRDREYEFLHILDKLGIMTVTVLKAASIIGMRFSLHFLQAVLTEMNLSHCAELDSLTSAVNTLLDVGLIKTATVVYTSGCSLVDSHYCFVDAVFQETVYMLMLLSQRVNGHAMVAGYLERRYRHSPHMLGSIADHYSRSTNARKQVEYLRLASSVSASKGEFLRAISYLSKLVLLATGKNGWELLMDAHHSESVYLDTLFDQVRLVVAGAKFEVDSGGGTPPTERNADAYIDTLPRTDGKHSHAGWTVVVADTCKRFVCGHRRVKIAAGATRSQELPHQCVTGYNSYHVLRGVLDNEQDFRNGSFKTAFLARKDATRKFMASISDHSSPKRAFAETPREGLRLRLRNLFRLFISSKSQITDDNELVGPRRERVLPGVLGTTRGEFGTSHSSDTTLNVPILEGFSELGITCTHVAMWLASVSMYYYK